MFVCGPTVYDLSHIGHARTYIVFDAFAKYLRQSGYKVFYLQNITDIDDKIIQRAQELGEKFQALARRFEKEYFKDMKSLGVNSVTKYARATDHIKEIISQIQRLLKKGYVYKTEDGIYYDIKKFKNYGKLSGRTIEQAEDGVSRIDESVQKRNKGDFALWKYSKPGEPSWSFDSSFAFAQDSLRTGLPAGRPGWHIEDTAIAEKYFGAQYDIHGGARDLIFPHHEAEIAQMEAVSGKKPLVKYWMHTGFLTINGEKMSKSLGNFITIRDFLQKHSARLLRFFVLKTHYRSPIDYGENLIEQTKQELERIDEFISKLTEKFEIRSTKSRSGPEALQGRMAETNSKFKIQKFQTQFEQALEEDFNTAKAIAVIFELIKQGNTLMAQNVLSKKSAKEIVSFLTHADKIFGFIFWGKRKMQKVPAEIMKLVKTREEYRKQQNWQKSDELRKQIESNGWEIEDTLKGPRLKLK